MAASAHLSFATRVDRRILEPTGGAEAAFEIFGFIFDHVFFD